MQATPESHPPRPLPTAPAAGETAPLAVIMPTRGLDAAVSARLEQVHTALRPRELVVVEPEGAAPVAPTPLPCRRIRAPRGRGTQCNAGARATTAPVLLFLHDDTQLPPDADRAIASALADQALGMACFRLRFDHRHPVLALYAWCSRFDSVWTTFGDQGYLIRRALFDAVGGFPDWPLFEDVELARRVRRQPGPWRRIRKLSAAVTTSAVRFQRGGVLRQQLRNATAMLRFFAGVSPARLAEEYERRH
ncbi:TIGR04283 family arsenosugar biosynthesis glycosyltransferase [Thiohalocapsa halophila]|uniref:TIGR04283 family arsenosugar biosynthesis glycosyltransferase n=1 Tax=Thiohalocapsa halophila TaxID=69359 RepID=UPI001F5B8000|nr:glycosyltransferase family 2 protein [Thiohalocapsa halophila]